MGCPATNLNKSAYITLALLSSSHHSLFAIFTPGDQNSRLGTIETSAYYSSTAGPSKVEMENKEMSMLVYEHKCNGRKMIPNGLCALVEEDIVVVLSMNPDVRAVKKTIQPKKTSIDIFKADLMTDEEKQASAEGKKKDGEKVEEIPWKLFLGHDMDDHAYTELLILVPDVVAKGGKEETAE